MKKIFNCITLSFLLLTLAACSSDTKNDNEDNPNTNFNSNSEISVVSREEGSGTRTAFIELFGVEVKDADGNKNDMTTKEAIIADKTNIMMTNVSGDWYAIGYCSLGSLDSTVKAISIDGALATVENIKNASYRIQRPFNIAYKGEPEGLTKDFISFIFSEEGQNVIAANKYIKVDENTSPYNGNMPSGKIVIGGSSSVEPVMQKLREAYLEINPNASIEIQLTDSSEGMSSAISGNYNIGMASRELKDSEKAELNDVTIAIDGIAVIVNKENPVDNLKSEQVKSIFTGESVKWSDTQ